MSQCIKYWLSLITMDGQRYPKQFCVQKLKTCCSSMGLGTFGQQTKLVTRKYSSQFSNNGLKIVHTKLYIQTYTPAQSRSIIRNIKPCWMLNATFQLICAISLKELSLFRSLVNCRVGTVSTYRQRIQIILSYRSICIKHDIHVLEDEMHFMFVCPLYDTLRVKYFQTQWLNSIVCTRLFYQVMSENDKSSICVYRNVFVQ